LEAYIRGLPDEHDEVDFVVRDRTEVEFDVEERYPESA
jgi:hypothetical protein